MSEKPAAGEAFAFKKSVGREYLESIVVAVILALFVRTFAVQAFKIPTGSMRENLLIGDHLLVNKLVYSPSLGPLEDAFLGKRKVERGHVVVFKYPEDPTRDFIKRVIALPGETVEVRNKRVYIDGRLLEEDVQQCTTGPGDSMNCEDADPSQGGPYKIYFLHPPASAGEIEDGLSQGETGPDNWGPHVVPGGRVLVLGDNRDNSRDGRYWIDPFLPIDQVKGRALLVYWSWSADREDYQGAARTSGWRSFVRFLDPREWRWGRFFHLIR